MSIRVKRAYDVPEPADGTRILVDRLWPRGLSKKNAKFDLWLKELSPSAELRTWFHERPNERYREFAKKYKTELSRKRKIAGDIFKDLKNVTLVTAVKDVEHSHIPTLVAFLKNL